MATNPNTTDCYARPLLEEREGCPTGTDMQGSDSKKTYETPQLIVYGEVEDLTGRRRHKGATLGHNGDDPERPFGS